MRPRIVYTQTFMTLGQPLRVEFKPDKKTVIFLFYYLLLFSVIIVPTLGLALGLAI